MTGMEQYQPSGEPPRPAPAHYLPEDSDWLLSRPHSPWRSDTEPPRHSDRSMWRPRPPKFGPLLDRVEARRLVSLLDGSAVRLVETPDGPRRALVHRHWAGLALRMAGASSAIVVAIAATPVLLALVVLSVSHGLVIAARRDVKPLIGGIIAGSEILLGLVVNGYVGPGWLRSALILSAVVMAGMTVLAWQVDMELITEGGRLVRTRGLLLMKRTVEAPLSSIRITDITGPFLGLGLVSVDTTSDQDQLLHNFGLIGQPNEWAALLLREANPPNVTTSKAD